MNVDWASNYKLTAVMTPISLPRLGSIIESSSLASGNLLKLPFYTSKLEVKKIKEKGERTVHTSK